MNIKCEICKEKIIMNEDLKRCECGRVVCVNCITENEKCCICKDKQWIKVLRNVINNYFNGYCSGWKLEYNAGKDHDTFWGQNDEELYIYHEDITFIEFSKDEDSGILAIHISGKEMFNIRYLKN